MYKAQANAEKAEFINILEGVRKEAGVEKPVPEGLVDEFIKNCHQLKILKGRTAFGEEDDSALREFLFTLTSLFPILTTPERTNERLAVMAIMTNPSQVSTHLAFNALSSFQATHARWPIPGSEQDLAALKVHAEDRLKRSGYVETEQDEGEVEVEVDEAATGPASLSFSDHLNNALGEM